MMRKAGFKKVRDKKWKLDTVRQNAAFHIVLFQGWDFDSWVVCEVHKYIKRKEDIIIITVL